MISRIAGSPGSPSVSTQSSTPLTCMVLGPVYASELIAGARLRPREAGDDVREQLVRRHRGERGVDDLDLDRAGVAGAFDEPAESREVDDAVAHEAAAGEQVGRGHEAV